MQTEMADADAVIDISESEEQDDDTTETESEVVATPHSSRRRRSPVWAFFTAPEGERD